MRTAKLVGLLGLAAAMALASPLAAFAEAVPNSDYRPDVGVTALLPLDIFTARGRTERGER